MQKILITFATILVGSTVGTVVGVYLAVRSINKSEDKYKT